MHWVPDVLKPANLGSSVGVVKIHSADEFERGVRFSAQYDRKILIEKGISGRELECAIIGNDTPSASVVGEVVSAHEFYDYEAKYANPESRLDIPARIDSGKAEEIRDLAVRAFKAIDGSGLPASIFWNTVPARYGSMRSIPCLDLPISMYAKLWAASGVDSKNW